MSTTAAALQGEDKTASGQWKPTLYRVLFAVSLVHLLNDSMQSVFPALMSILKDKMHISYFQVGFVIFALNVTSSIMQPVVGLYTDKKPSPYLLPLGMVFSCIGMLTLSFAANYYIVLIAVVMVGLGSAVFHPEGSRVSNMAAGGRRGLAQSIYQVGGNGGSALGPLMTTLVFAPLGQLGALWFTLVAGLAIIVQVFIARWYRAYLIAHPRPVKSAAVRTLNPLVKKKVANAVTLLVFLVFARSWYHASVSGYYVFYAMQKFHISAPEGQLYIFGFLAAGAAGTLLGGPLADRFGRKTILFFSMLGSAPFAVLLPYANEFWAYIVLLITGFILLSSFSVAVVYAQELVPGKIGLISGLIVGLAFGMGALGSVALGSLADLTSISFMMKLCSYLPLMGLLTAFLPSDSKIREWSAER